MAAVGLALGYTWLGGGFVGWLGSGEPADSSVASGSAGIPAVSAPEQDGLARATFAAGCFWCVESDFDALPGVVSTTSGYTGGHTPNPTYRQVSTGGTGHTEAVEILFDPSIVTYDRLLDHFWRNVDPFVATRQFCDVGEQYRPAIFVHDEAQRRAAEASKQAMDARFDEPILVQVSDAGRFYRAETYHQDYYRKNPTQYRFYRWRCGRDARLEAIWQDQRD